MRMRIVGKRSRKLRYLAILALLFGIWGVPILASAAPAQNQESQTGPKAKKAQAPTPVKNASEADIQAAKASGKVWVNTATGVYHKGGRWFGATKQGKFMAEQEAVKSGYRAAKNEK